jgi:hypothetical protein
LGSTREQHKAAYTYLALAFTVLENEKIKICIANKTVEHSKLFHFAGHAFREIGQVNRAADAYWRAGITDNRGKPPSDWGIRSLARAKVCFREVGEVEKSDEMHCLEWEARRHWSPRVRKFVLSLWALTSQYGTAPRRWLVSLLVVFGGSALMYELMHRLLWIHQGQTWTPWASAIYYCAVTMTTLGYGEFVPTHWVAQSFVVLNIAFGYLLLAVGITILGHKVIGR